MAICLITQSVSTKLNTMRCKDKSKDKSSWMSLLLIQLVPGNNIIAKHTLHATYFTCTYIAPNIIHFSILKAGKLYQ